ncbi:MAG: F0F1 ATP synthase subunit delta [Oscillospiraceae bacterium]|nr:F0F1 ATP synthase subunit delta [Oscillospiraceae bacterium]
MTEMIPEDFSHQENIPHFSDGKPESEDEELFPEEPEKELTELDYTRIQMEAMLRDAAREAEEILEQAREAAKIEAENVYQAAREAGRQEGYQEGVLQALEEGRLRQEQEAAQLTADVQDFLDRANTVLDRQLDENINELRDLAIAIAEKVVCISLRSSTEVIGRMVQAALDKRKQREWIHIYISESDAKRMSQIPASLASALSGISNRVRIIPMADDDSGTCVIEMPDEIIDASASTQLSNIRSMLMNGRQSETDFGNFEF